MVNKARKALLRLPAVIMATGMSRATIYRRVAEGAFPSPIRLGSRSVAWDADEVDEWIKKIIAASRT